MESLNDFCNRIHESSSHITASKDPRERLQKLQKTWKLKMWHDHSDILNHSYVSFMTCFLYDPINVLTDQEFREQHPEKKPVNVQSTVERPQLYIFGISGSFFYVKCINHCIDFHKNYHIIEVNKYYVHCTFEKKKS